MAVIRFFTRWILYPVSSLRPSRQSRAIDPMLDWCWADVDPRLVLFLHDWFDIKPTLSQHCMLGRNLDQLRNSGSFRRMADRLPHPCFLKTLVFFCHMHDGVPYIAPNFMQCYSIFNNPRAKARPHSYSKNLTKYWLSFKNHFFSLLTFWKWSHESSYRLHVLQIALLYTSFILFVICCFKSPLSWCG